MRPMFGALSSGIGKTSILFVSQASVNDGNVLNLGLKKRIEPVVKCRGLTKADMKLNDALPKITVDPKTYKVSVDGAEVGAEPVSVVPLAQRYNLF
jgi:urease alpha subunit